MAKVQDSAVGISLNQKEQLKMMKKLKSSFLLDKYISFCYSVTEVFVIFNYLRLKTFVVVFKIYAIVYLSILQIIYNIYYI